MKINKTKLLKTHCHIPKQVKVTCRINIFLPNRLEFHLLIPECNTLYNHNWIPVLG